MNDRDRDNWLNLLGGPEHCCKANIGAGHSEWSRKTLTTVICSAEREHLMSTTLYRRMEESESLVGLVEDVVVCLVKIQETSELLVRKLVDMQTTESWTRWIE